MNVEENRLRTFNSWPSNYAVEPARIAKGGFFATGNHFEVQCFSCECKIDDWNYGDQVMVRHRILSPTCPFVLDLHNSGNVPLTTSSLPPTASTSDTTVRSNDMSVVANRLQSFRNWPSSNIVPSELLANAGFYYLNINDKVRCFKCDVIIGHWEAGDLPIVEHNRLAPGCEFIREVCSKPLVEKTSVTTVDNEQLLAQMNFKELQIQMHKGPNEPRYATLEARLRTFDGWPDDLVQTPEQLAQAGFYYTGSSDHVRCFHCGGGLRRWDPQDEPWFEHARCFPTCLFLLLAKGQMFVNRCSEGNDSSETIVDGVSSRPTGAVPLDRMHTVTDQELQMLMDSPEARAALSIGLHVGRIKQAIKYKVEQTGVSFSTADALIEAALNIQLEEPNSNPGESDSHMSDTVHQLLSEAICQANAVESCRKSNKKVKSQSNTTTKPVDASEQIESNVSLEEENRRLKEARLCKICLDLEVGVVFLPCGHLTSCINCAPNLKFCPVCRSPIKAFVRTFLS